MEIENLIKSEENQFEFNLERSIQVLKDIKSLNESYPELTVALNKDFNEIKLTKHLEDFLLQLAYLDKGQWTISAHNLPERVNLLQEGKAVTLKSAIETYKATIEGLGEYYEIFELIDKNLQVVAPMNSTKKDNWRLVRYNKDIYARIELPNPLNAGEAHVIFYSKEEQVQKMQEAYNGQDFEENVYWRLHYMKYDQDEDICEESLIDCGICFSFYDDHSQCPLIFCNNSICPQRFHQSCLSTHLKVSHMKILNVAVGECPYCKFKIQVNVASDNANKEN